MRIFVFRIAKGKPGGIVEASCPIGFEKKKEELNRDCDCGGACEPKAPAKEESGCCCGGNCDAESMAIRVISLARIRSFLIQNGIRRHLQLVCP